MKFWKEHVQLRVSLIAAFFAAGLLLVIVGFRMTGNLGGLGLMMLGVACLLTSLWVYNKPFETPREKTGE